MFNKIASETVGVQVRLVVCLATMAKAEICLEITLLFVKIHLIYSTLTAAATFSGSKTTAQTIFWEITATPLGQATTPIKTQGTYSETLLLIITTIETATMAAFSETIINQMYGLLIKIRTQITCLTTQITCLTAAILILTISLEKTHKC